jgi:hypothetical protein
MGVVTDHEATSGQPSRAAVPRTAAGIADELRAALDLGDLERLGALLSDDVRWGPPGSERQPCRNRSQVLRWWAKARRAGRRATVTEVEVHGNALLVGLDLDDGHRRWQVLRVGPGGIDDIRGFEDRSTASQQLRS